jgi:hypothetical protein
VTQRDRASETAEKETLTSQPTTEFLVGSCDAHVTRLI